MLTYLLYVPVKSLWILWMNSLINEKNPSFTFSLCAKTLLKSVICDVTKGTTI